MQDFLHGNTFPVVVKTAPARDAVEIALGLDFG
jgi:hypothetical protein